VCFAHRRRALRIPMRHRLPAPANFCGTYLSPSIYGAAHAITCIATLRRLPFEFPRFYIELPPLTHAYKWRCARGELPLCNELFHVHFATHCYPFSVEF